MSWRGAPLPAGWREVRAGVLARDGYRCTFTVGDGKRCPHPATEVDHIGDRNNHDPSNLRAACRWHHARRTSQQANAAKQRKTQRREPEPHPGLRR